MLHDVMHKTPAGLSQSARSRAAIMDRNERLIHSAREASHPNPKSTEANRAVDGHFGTSQSANDPLQPNVGHVCDPEVIDLCLQREYLASAHHAFASLKDDTAAVLGALEKRRIAQLPNDSIEHVRVSLKPVIPSAMHGLVRHRGYQYMT